MRIVFDMDNTLVDELGQKARPGIRALLEKLAADDHELVLWTSSSRERAKIILSDHEFERFFARFLFREDYDPKNTGAMKDIRKIDADVLIDDDPRQVDFANKAGRRGILISAYRGGDADGSEELNAIYAAIRKERGLFKRLFG